MLGESRIDKTEGAAGDVEIDAKPDAECPGRPTPELSRSGEAPPPEGLAPSPASLMPEQSTPTGVKVDVADVREEAQDGAAFDPKSCPIQSEKIPITTVYRPDLMPDRVEGSIAPVVEYDMTSVPVALPKFTAVDDSIHGRGMPTLKRHFSRPTGRLDW